MKFPRARPGFIDRITSSAELRGQGAANPDEFFSDAGVEASGIPLGRPALRRIKAQSLV
jgi:hypothetical protein